MCRLTVSPSCFSNLAELGRKNSIRLLSLSNCCRTIRLGVTQYGPRNPSELICQTDDSDIRVHALFKLIQPGSKLMSASVHVLDDGSSAMN
jgi:hypothetical protein